MKQKNRLVEACIGGIKGLTGSCFALCYHRALETKTGEAKGTDECA